MRRELVKDVNKGDMNCSREQCTASDFSGQNLTSNFSPLAPLPLHLLHYHMGHVFCLVRYVSNLFTPCVKLFIICSTTHVDNY